MITTKNRLFFLLVFFFVILPAHAAVRAKATVDRTTITQGDSFILTVRIDDTGGYDNPDYRPLENDFQIFGTSQSSQHVINNGRIESWTEWQTTLIPKRNGQLTIPALSVAGTQTQPIAVRVNPATQNANAFDGSEPVYIEVETDSSNVYVQQQLLFTARVFIATSLVDMQLTKPEFDNANVKQVSETSFNRTLNGMQYEVHELVYAIFPQQAGELTIPELVFSGVEARRQRSLFDFPGQGRAMRKMSRQLTVHVKPIPKTFSGKVWLPARNLTLAESWSGDMQRLAVGESITRNISVRADGLPAAQLPAIEQPMLDGAKIYADQPSMDNEQSANGITGKRIEKAALIPTRPGQLSLPETRVAWWDVDSDSEKIATLAGQTLKIEAGATGVNAAPDTTLPEQTPAPSPQSSAPETSIQSSNATTNAQLIAWQIATACLALLSVLMLVLYWRLKRNVTPQAPINSINANDGSGEKNAWRDFSAACHRNDAAAARHALLKWARIYFDDQSLLTIEQLQRVTNDDTFMLALRQLENRLFGTLPDSGEWNGEMLLAATQSIRNTRRETSVADEHLPPLYPVK